MAAAKTVWPEEWDTTDALTQLIAQFNASADYYNPKSAADIEAQARDEAAALYNAQRLAATQAQERSDLALAQQYAGLQASYDKSRDASQKQYNQAYSQAGRGMVGRGMQRSSYGAQTLANISKQGAEAQQALWDQQTAAEGNINAQRAQLAQQLAAQLQQYDTDEALAIQNRMRELEDQEYQRGMENQQYRAKLSDTIYAYLQDQQKSGGGSGSGGGQNPQTDPTAPAPAASPTSNWNAFLNALSGAAKVPAGTKVNPKTNKQIKYEQKTAYADPTTNKALAYGNRVNYAQEQKKKQEEEAKKKKAGLGGGGYSPISFARID